MISPGQPRHNRKTGKKTKRVPVSMAEPEPNDIARLTLLRLGRMADPDKAAGAQAFFKETVPCYGVSSPDLRRLASDLYASVKETWNLAEALELCRILLPRPELEAKASAILVLERFSKEFKPSLLPIIKSWLEKNLLDNWASLDALCSVAMAGLLMKYPSLTVEVRTWAFHPNPWVRRASAVSFVKLARKWEFLDSVYEIASSLLRPDEDLVHKAVGWLLREAGKTDCSRLEKFLLQHGPQVPRITVRYAIERFPEGKRKELLARTKRS